MPFAALCFYIALSCSLVAAHTTEETQLRMAYLYFACSNLVACLYAMSR